MAIAKTFCPSSNNVDTNIRFRDSGINEINEVANNQNDIVGSINPFLNEENNMNNDLKNNEEIKI